MNDIFAMKNLDSTADVISAATNLHFIHELSFEQVLVKVTAWKILTNEIKVVYVIEVMVELCNIRVVDITLDLDFHYQLFFQGFIIKHFLWDGLYGEHKVCVVMSC